MSSTNKIDWCSTWFNTDYYHLLYAHRNNDEAELFIKNLILNLRIPEGAKVLDIACGKGRHACILSKYHLKVWGIDIASNSIEEAKKNSHPAITFEVFDMRNVYKKTISTLYLTYLPVLAILKMNKRMMPLFNLYLKTLRKKAYLFSIF